MAKLAKKQVKKKFFEVEIPSLKKQVELYGKAIEDLNNNNIKLNLANELHGKAIDVKLNVTVENEKATAVPTEVKLLSAYVKRMARKGTDYAENSFLTECKDNKIKIKSLAITRKRVTKKVLADLAKKSREELIGYVKDKKFEEIVTEILANKLQKTLMIKLKKIYPLNTFEIKYLGIYTKEEYEETSKIAKKKIADEKKAEEETKPKEEKKEEKQ